MLAATRWRGCETGFTENVVEKGTRRRAGWPLDEAITAHPPPVHIFRWKLPMLRLSYSEKLREVSAT